LSISASHDTHVFRLAEPLNETIILDKLDYPINMWGAENGKTNPVNVLFSDSIIVLGMERQLS